MYEDICYGNPFLKEVIARIDFAGSIEGLVKALPHKLAKALSAPFPISEPVDAIASQIQLTGGEVRHQETQFKQWNFFGRDREKQLALAAPFLFITYNQYSTFENLKTEVAAVVDAVAKSFPDARAARFGLRYINSIEIGELVGPTSWDEYIVQDLLATTAFFTEPNYLTRLVHIAELKVEDLGIRFQFGMPNPDYPATLRRAQFVLDLDAYVQTTHDLGESLQYMEQAHEQIQKLFERSITDKLRERMNARPAIPVQD